ncbi:NAD(+) synthase, partial [Candidatus Margulisiibacteriota bacterium]
MTKKKSNIVSLLQFNPVVGNPEYNAVRIISYLEKAKQENAGLALIGELALSGYCARDLFRNDDFLDRNERAWGMVKYAAEKLDIGVGAGIVQRNPTQHKGEKHLLNSFALIFPGKEEIIQSKVCLPTYGEFVEDRWFQSAPLHSLTVQKINDMGVGILICEDSWNSTNVLDPRERLYEEDPIDYLFSLDNKPEVLISISASPDYVGKQEYRISMFSQVAQKYTIPVIFLNVAGAQDELVFGGRSFILNSKGQLVHEMAGFAEDLFTIDISSIDSMKKISSEIDSMEELDRMVGLYLTDYFGKSRLRESDTFKVMVNTKSQKPDFAKATSDKSKVKSQNLKDELYRSEEQVKKIVENFSQTISPVKVVVGLSGGKDSTTAATICKRHLGAENVIGVILPYRLGEYTQKDSQDLAQKLAKGLGIRVIEITLDDFVDHVPKELFKELHFSEGDLVHQNIQARMRSLILWTIANKENAIVINTTNFSEAALGYGTIGGDLLGLPLIASLPATLVKKYLGWLKSHGEQAITDTMIHKKPSAELAPDQFDADDLGEYEYIDVLLEDLRMNHGNVKKTIVDTYPYKGTNEEKEEFIKTVRFLANKLLVQSEYKRQYYNRTPQFTPYSWLRWQWPVANGYFDV